MRGYFLVMRDETPPFGITAGLPAYSVRSWFTGSRLVSVPGAQLCDPLTTQGDINTLLSGFFGLAGWLGIRRAEIRTFHTRDKINDKRFSAIRSYKCHLIPLDGKPEQLKKRFHRSCVRQRIDRAIASGLTVQRAEREEDLHAFHNLYAENRVRKQLPVPPYNFFCNLWREFAHDGRMRIRLCRYEGRVIAGLLLYFFNGRASADMMAWRDECSSFSPGHLLFWEAIREASLEGLRTFDFGCTHESITSLMEYKSRWGTTVVDLPRFYSPPRPPQREKGPVENFAYKTARLVIRATPMSAQAWLGRQFYRHLG
jgi:hypothetical protein